MSDWEAIRLLLDEAKRLSAIWHPSAEDKYREAINAAAQKSDLQPLATAWVVCGDYLLERLQVEASCLAFSAALDAARHNPELTNVIIERLRAAQRDGHDEVTAAFGELLVDNGSSPSVGGQLPASSRSERGLDALRSKYPDFDQRFGRGELRFDGSEQVALPLRGERAHHHKDTKYSAALRSRLRSAARHLLNRMVVMIGSLVLLAAVFHYISPGTWLALACIVVVVVLFAIQLQPAWYYGRGLHQVIYEMRLARILDRLTEQGSTHDKALAAWQRFAETREPYALYLRSFEAEGHEYLSSRGLTLTPQPDQFVAGEGDSARGMVVGWHSGPTDLDRYLSQRLTPHLPVITLCNPAAGSPAMGGQDLATLRLEVPNQAWVGVVRLLISAAQLIVIEALLDGPGLREELRSVDRQDRVADTVVVVSLEAQKGEILKRRVMSGVNPGEGAQFVSSVSPLLESFGRIVCLPDIEATDPADTIAFQGLLPNPADQTQSARVARRERRQQDLDEARSAMRTGTASFREEDIAEACNAFTRARKLFAQIGSPSDESFALNWLSQVCFNQGDIDRTEQHLRAAIALQESAGPPPEHIRSLTGLALFLNKTGRSNEAREVEEQLQETCRKWALALQPPTNG